MEHEPGHGGRSKRMMIYPESPKDDADPLAPGKIFGSSLPSSSSSSSSHSPVDGRQRDGLDDSFTKSEQDSLSSLGPGHVSSPEVVSQTSEWSMVNESPMAAGGLLSSPEAWTQTPEESTINASPMKSPPLQTMEQLAGYDPNRIPASIFSSKTTTPTEWSVTSNESLFSIYGGENSVCKDNSFLFGKSGELTKFDEFKNSQSNTHSASETKFNESNNIQSSLPTVPEVAAEHHRRNATEKDPRVKDDVNGGPEVVLKEISEGHEEKMPSAWASSSTSESKGMLHFEAPHTSANTRRLSNESAHSASSFAFPMLAGDIGKDDSVNPVFEETQSKPPMPKATPQTTENNVWFFFSCCPIRCCL